MSAKIIIQDIKIIKHFFGVAHPDCRDTFDGPFCLDSLCVGRS